MGIKHEIECVDRVHFTNFQNRTNKAWNQDWYHDNIDSDLKAKNIRSIPVLQILLGKFHPVAMVLLEIA